MYSTNQAENKIIFLNSMIFADTVEMSHFHNKFESNHLPKIGEFSSPTPPYPAATAQSLIQHSVTAKTIVFFPATNRFRD